MKQRNKGKAQKRAAWDFANKFLTVLLTVGMVLQTSPLQYAYSLDEGEEPAIEAAAEEPPVVEEVAEPEPEPVPEPEPEPEPESEPAPVEETATEDPAPVEEPPAEPEVVVEQPADEEEPPANTDATPAAPEALADDSSQQAEDSTDVNKPTAEDQPDAAAKPAEEPEEKPEEEPAAPAPTKTEYVADDGAVRVTAVLDDPAAIPDDAQLVVAPVTNGTQATYLQALNNTTDSDQPVYTEANTVLYDVAFLVTNDAQETVEVQPAQGAVTLTFEFLNAQLSVGLGIDDPSALQAFHLPLADYAKAQTTQASTGIGAGDVIVEQISGGNLGILGADTLVLVARSFSVFAISNQPAPSEETDATPTEETKAEPTEETKDEAQPETTPDDAATSKAKRTATSEPTRAGDTRATIDPNITDLLTEVKVYENGVEVPYTAEGKLDIVAGRDYEIKLSFQETDDHQFVIDGTTMYYDLPVNLSALEPLDGTFVMDFGALGSLQNNTYHIADGKIAINWNTADSAGMEILNALGSAHFSFRIEGEFDSTSDHIEWSKVISTEIDVKEEHDATVSKKGTYDKDNDEIDYVVTVTSKGTTTGVVVTDTITGTALESKVQSISDIVVKKNGIVMPLDASSLTIDAASKRFTLHLPEMDDGDVYTVEYSAGVKYSALHQNGTTTYDEANNSVELNWNENGDNPPERDNTYKHNIDFSSFQKRSVKLGDEVVEGDKTYRYIDWEIKANDARKVPLTYVTDTIAAGSRSRMTYCEGIQVTAQFQDGTAATRSLTWGQSSADGRLELEADRSSWTYYPPHGEIASYVITYQTKVDVTDLTEPIEVKNDSHDEYDHSGSGQPVGPNKPEVQLNKRVVTTTEDKTVWAIDIIVPKDGLDSAKVTDTLPMQWIDNLREYDEISSIEVTGDLLEGESYKIELAYHSVDPSDYPQKDFTLPYGQDPGDDTVANYEAYVTFYKDAGQTTEGLKPSDGNRVITVTVTTKTNEKWLARDAVTPQGNGHMNTAKMGSITKTATAYPVKKTISKQYATKMEGVHLLSSKGFTSDPYTIYKYKVRISGARTDVVEIEDTFDTEVFQAFVGDEVDTNWYETNRGWKWYEIDGHKANELYYGNDVNNDGTLANKVSDAGSMSRYQINVTNTATGAIISTSHLPKTESGDYYSYYTIYYYLIMKDPAKAQEKAYAAGGQATFKNLAGWEGGESDVDITYGNPILDKSSVVADDKKTATYTIKINPDKYTLNNGQSMMLTDDFSKTLSIDYTSITITTDPKATVSYDYYGNQGVFVIPDATAVTITYTANVVGTGNLELYNKAKLEGDYEDSTDDFIKKDASGTGGGDLFYIQLLKYKSGNMQEDPLAGATFRLLDSEMNPIKYTDKVQVPESQALIGQDITFTTDSDVLRLMLSRARHGTNFKKDTVYYLEEIQAPPGMQLDPTLYSFVITDGDARYQREDGIWVYYVGDILKVRNYPEQEQLTLYKRFAGNVQLTAGQKAKIWFEVIQVDDSGVPVTGGFKKTVRYADLEYDKYYITSATQGDDGSGPFGAGTYKVVEHNASAADLDLDDDVVATTTHKVDAGDEQGGTEISSVVVASGKNVNAIFTNSYSTNAYYFTKYDPGKGEGEQPIEGAVFTVYRASNNEVVTTHTTGSDGKFFISMRDENSHYVTDTLYYVVETGTPEGYVVPDNPQRYYFYFAEQGAAVPEGLPDGATAVNLGVTSASETVFNTPKSTILVEKDWKGADGSNLPEGELRALTATVHLKRKVAAYDAGTQQYDEPTDDTTFDESAQLNYQNDFKKSWSDLTVIDEATGDKYTYYVTEDAVSGFTTTYVHNDGIQEGTITVVNTKRAGAALKLTKLVTVNSEPASATNANIVDGVYEFEITKGSLKKTVRITVTNGVASAAEIDGVSASLDSDGYVEVTGLTPGLYTVAEVGKVAGTSLVKVTDGSGTSLTVEENAVEVTVADGSEVALSATIAFTNNADTTEHHETTTYSGTKTWRGTNYESQQPTIHLYADGEKTDYTPTWEKPAGSPVWTYEFTNLPVFAEDGHAIAYTAQEESLPSYVGSITNQVLTSYELTPPSNVVVEHACNTTSFNIASSLDLAFVIIKTTDQTFIIWTQRQPSLSERNQLTQIANEKFPDSTGKDIDFVWSTPYVYRGSHGRTASIAYKNKSISLEFSHKDVWTSFAYGAYSATYNPGTTDFLNTEVGGLTVTKTVSSPVEADKTMSFTFTVSILKDDAVDTDFSGTYGDMTFENGECTFTLSDGQSKQATGIPVGTTYQVKEETDPNFTVVPSTGVIKGTIVANVTTAAFTNKRALGSLKIQKVVQENGETPTTVTVKSALAGDYTFGVYTDADCTITAKDAFGQEVGSITLTVTDDGAPVTSAEITNLSAGDYWVKETAPNNATHVEGDNPVKVSVEAGKVGTEAVIATITNNYETVEVPVTKAWENADGTKTWPAGIESVTVKLLADGTQAATHDLTAEEPSYTFEDLPKYQADGTTKIEYTLEEVEVPGYTPVITGKAADGFTVTNTQDVGALKITKTVEGVDAPDKQFTVTITNAAGKYLKADGTLSDVEVTHKVSNVAPLEIQNVPIGEYTVSELDTDRTITNYSFVGVTGEGTQKVTKNESTTFDLTNTYSENGEFEIKATKVIKDGTWPKNTDGTPKEAVFKLTASEGAPLPKKDGVENDELKLTEANAPGSFGVVALKIDDFEKDHEDKYIAKTFTYTISETSDWNVEGAKFKWEKSADITVTVTAEVNAAGKVVTNVTYDTTSKGNITNTYTPDKPDFDKKIQDTNDSTGQTSGWQDSADYDIGDAVPYRLRATLAEDVTSYKQYHITFIDEMEPSLTFEKVSAVTVNGKEAAYQLTKTDDQHFSVKLEWGDGKELIADEALNGAEVVVYFTAILNENAILGSQGNVNKAKLEYSCKPTTDEVETTDWDFVIAFTYKVDVNKVDPSGKALDGAEFKLEKVLADGSTVELARLTGTAANVFSFKGLDDGDYVLTEVASPKGYKPIEPVEFTVTADHTIEWTDEGARTSILTTLTGDVTTGEIALAADVAAGTLTGDVVNEEHDKPDFDKKIKDTNDSTGQTSGWQDSADYDIGDAVPYRLRATLPDDVTTYKHYHITFTDQMEESLTFNGIDAVTVNGEAATYTLDESDAHSFKLTLEWGDGKDLIADETLNGAEVCVFFTSTLNDAAILGAEGNVNGAKLTYSNNSTSDGEEDTDELDWDYVIAFTYKVDVNKVDPNGKALDGAEFKLEKMLVDGSAVELARLTGTAANVFSFKGLDDGVYVLTETKVPAGYKAIDPIAFTVTADHSAAWDVNSPAAAPATFDLVGRTGVLGALTGNVTTGEIALAADVVAGTLAGNVVNEYAPNKTAVSVKKLWTSMGREMAWPSGARVTVALMADGAKVDEHTLTADAPSYTFANLPKTTADGKEIAYTVSEIRVSGLSDKYNSTVSGEAAAGFVIKNSIERLPKTGDPASLGLIYALATSGLSSIALGLRTVRKRMDGEE